MDQKKRELKERFEMTDMGEVTRILGMEVKRDYDQGTLAITQTDYVENLLERFEMQNANVAYTPGYGQELSSEQPEDKLLGAQGIKLYQSITGGLLYLAQCTSFGSKTQSLTAQSTVESELQALSYGAREAVYLSNFLTELGLKDSSQVPIRSDSTGALSVAGNSMFSASTKHVALRYFFVRELVKKNNITLHYTPTKQMLADIATKHLSKHTFRDLLQQIKNFTS